MGLDVKLENIQFSNNNTCISSVQCSLSNKRKSPLIQKEGIDHADSKTIRFDASKPIRSVQAYSGPGYIYRIDFIDSANNSVYYY